MGYAVRTKEGLVTLDWIAESINDAIIHTGMKINEEDIIDVLVENNEVLHLGTGISATSYGRLIGICDQVNTYTNETTCLFDIDAQEKIITQVLSAYDLVQISYKYSRKYYAELYDRYPNDVIILEGDKQFWSYDSDAEFIEEQTEIAAYENANNKTVICFNKDGISFVVSKIEQKRIYIDNPDSEDIYFFKGKDESTDFAEEIPCVVIGSIVCFADEEGETDEIEIINPEELKPVSFYDAMGDVHVFMPPEITWEPFNYIVAYSSPFGAAVLGKTEGELFEVEAAGTIKKYCIEEIFYPGYLKCDRDVYEMAEQLEKLILQKKQLENQIKDIKGVLARKMDSQGIESFDTESSRIKRDHSKEITVEKADSIAVYEILEGKGYNCKTYSSTLRKNIINKMVCSDGELPHWLNDLVKVKDKFTVNLTKK